MQAMLEVSSSAGPAFVSSTGVLDCLVSNVQGLLVEAHERGSETILGRRHLPFDLDLCPRR